jgi:two-component system, LytTR family, response regulator
MKINTTNILKDNKTLCFKTHDGYIQVESEEIVFCHSEGPYTIIHTTNGRKCTISKPLKSIELSLEGTVFHRCHNSWLINMHKIEYFNSRGKLIIVNDHLQIPISKKRWKITLEKLLELKVPDRKNIVQRGTILNN